ncbi:predicted protein [Postia placenta Mad-698-R]|nr:predicted protein [Postia placenta Mad-698-R]
MSVWPDHKHSWAEGSEFHTSYRRTYERRAEDVSDCVPEFCTTSVEDPTLSPALLHPLVTTHLQYPHSVRAMGNEFSTILTLVRGMQAARANKEITPNPIMEELEARAREADSRARKAEERVRAAEAREKESRQKEARRAAKENAKRDEQDRAFAESAKRKAESDEASRQKTRAETQRKAAAAEESRRRVAEDEQRRESARTVAEEQARQAKPKEKKALTAKEMAEKAAGEAIAAAEKAKKALQEGSKPVITPTLGEFEATKKRLGYRDGLFHFAVAGTSGSGKSSLINACRGLRNGSDDPSVAKTGATETTSNISRYMDPNEANPFVWYDIPGAGTLKVPDAEYFNEQGLYAFDCIIVMMGIRFTATDAAILRNCARFQIPSYIVRSKSLQHIENIRKDMLGDDDEEDTKAYMEEAIEKYIADTRTNVADNLAEAQLPDQRVYMVDIDNICKIVKGKKTKTGIDECDLMRGLLSTARDRRMKPKAWWQYMYRRYVSYW